MSISQIVSLGAVKGDLTMLAEPRTSHPFHFYDAMTMQPQTWTEVLSRVRSRAEQVASRLSTARQIFLVGIGTSFSAAQLGQFFFSHSGVRVPVHAVHAFDFALYGPALSQDDCVIVISHRGTKQYSLTALKRARSVGCYTLFITGQQAPHNDDAITIMRTTPQEKASAFTFSFMGALAVLAVLAEATGEQGTGAKVPSPSLLEQQIPTLLSVCLEREQQVMALATKHLHHRRIWLVGGGPLEVIAQEIAMKVKETSYLQAEGMSSEAILHGPFQCVEPEDLFLLLAPAGAAQERLFPLAAMIKDIGASYLVIDDGSATGMYQDADGHCSAPIVPEPYNALPCLVLLQLFCYHLALGVGTNPDGFRLEDPRFATARKRVQL